MRALAFATMPRFRCPNAGTLDYQSSIGKGAHPMIPFQISNLVPFRSLGSLALSMHRRKRRAAFLSFLLLL